MNSVRAVFGVVAGAVLVALMGCAAGPAPTAEPTRTASPSTTPTPTATPTFGPAAVVVLFGDHLEVRDAAGAVLSEHPFDADEHDLVSALTAAFGSDPVVTTFDVAGECAAAGTAHYAWIDGDSSLSVTTSSPEAVAPWDTLDVRTAARSVWGISIETSAGFASGDDVTAFVDTLPADQRNDSGAFIWDRVTTYDSQPFGGTAFMGESGVVDFIGTPGLMQSWYC